MPSNKELNNFIFVVLKLPRSRINDIKENSFDGGHRHGRHQTHRLFNWSTAEFVDQNSKNESVKVN